MMSKEEYVKMMDCIMDPEPVWSDPVFECPVCGGGMCRNNQIVLPTYPPQHKYKCNKCDHIEYMY